MVIDSLLKALMDEERNGNVAPAYFYIGYINGHIMSGGRNNIGKARDIVDTWEQFRRERTWETI